jgi:hypothetical protein
MGPTGMSHDCGHLSLLPGIQRMSMPSMDLRIIPVTHMNGIKHITRVQFNRITHFLICWHDTLSCEIPIAPQMSQWLRTIEFLYIALGWDSQRCEAGRINRRELCDSASECCHQPSNLRFSATPIRELYHTINNSKIATQKM